MMMNNSQNQTKADEASFPNLTGYLDEADLISLIRNHTLIELAKLENAFGEIEAAMISIRRNAEVDSLDAIWTAITTIWDNSHDLLDEDD